MGEITNLNPSNEYAGVAWKDTEKAEKVKAVMKKLGIHGQAASAHVKTLRKHGIKIG